MFGIAARRMGYRVHAFEPHPDSPAGQISDVEVNASYDDFAALERFAREVDVISFEFENIPLSAIREVAKIRPLRPRGEVLHICQNREREKAFLREHGFPHAPFAVVESPEGLRAALDTIGTPSVLKTADFGYDGKGQLKARRGRRRRKDLGTISLRTRRARRVDPLSSGALRGCGARSGRSHAGFPTGRKPSSAAHSRHLDSAGTFPASIAEAAVRLACEITASLDVVGLLAVEFFLTQDSQLLVNELAPRPHNSGHYTFDACVTSQFEQQLRAVCGLPLGSTVIANPGRHVEPSRTPLEKRRARLERDPFRTAGQAPSLWKAGSPSRKEDGPCFGAGGSGRSSCFDRDFQKEARTLSFDDELPGYKDKTAGARHRRRLSSSAFFSSGFLCSPSGRAGPPSKRRA